ncbi:MAG: hypothetical protein J6J60_02075 [Clostridia bacterium]|nr:hypothetical protein [Clostridia bacterium]
MKKLIIICYVILFSMLSILAFLNFSFENEEKIEKNMQIISIEKPVDSTNQEYINTLNTISKNIECDIMFKFVDVTGDKIEKIYYKTNNTDCFIDMNSEKGLLNCEQGEIISTKVYEVPGFYRLNAANTNCEITFRNFLDATDHNFNSDVFYVKTEDCNKMITAITDCGYSVEPKQTELISGQYNIVIFAGIPIILFLASMAFYGFSNGKVNVLKKMDGFRNIDILKDDIKKMIIPFFIIFIIILMIMGIVNFLEYTYAFMESMAFWFKYMILGITVLIGGFALLSFIIMMQNKAEIIKGKVPQRGIYIIALMLKSCFIIFIVFFLSIAIRNCILAHNVYKTSEKLSQKVERYVSIPVFELNQSIEGLEKNYLEFYNNTVDKYNGILIESRNYEMDVVSGKTMCEEFGQDSITINSNYLEFNPIYDIEGEQITSDVLINDKLTVLIPQSKEYKTQSVIEQCKLAYEVDVNVIYYDQNKTKIYSYNARGLENSDGEISEPIIYIGNERIINEIYIFNYITGDYYFIKPETSNPYKELLPILEKLGISETTTKFTYISDNFKEEISNWLMMLKIYATQSILLFIGLFSIIIFTSKVYCENYKNRISIYLLEGVSLLTCIKFHIIMTIISYIFSFLLMKIGLDFGIGSNYSIMIFIGMMEVITIYIACRNFSRSNLNEIIKGAE